MQAGGCASILPPSQPRVEERKPEETAWSVYFQRALRSKDEGKARASRAKGHTAGLPGATPGRQEQQQQSLLEAESSRDCHCRWSLPDALDLAAP